MPRDMAQLAVRVARALHLDVAGIDILFDHNGYRICEANSSPGFQALEPACNISVPEIVFGAVRDRLERKKPVRRSFWRPLGALWPGRAHRRPKKGRAMGAGAYDALNPAE